MGKNITNTLVSKLKPGDKPQEIRDQSLRGFLLRVQPSGVMTYYFEYSRGKRVKIGPAEALSPEQARELARDIEHQYRKGDDPIEERKRMKASNYLHFIESEYQAYLVTHLRGGVDNAEHVKETCDCLKNRFAEFHKLRLEEITPQLIERWRQRRVSEGVKPSTINRQMNDLRACLNKAIDWGCLNINPFDRVKPSKVDTNRNVRYLSEEEEIRLRNALEDREQQIKIERARANEWRLGRGYDLYADLSEHEFADYLKPAVLLSLNTGLRRGELFGLKWKDVDFKQRLLTVSGDGAKSGQTRHIPLNEEALEVLKSWKQQPGLKSEWVLHGKNGEQLQNLRKSWIAVLDKAGIENFRWHDMRHDFASKLVMSGVDLNTVRELLGHSDYKMTLRYSHLAPKIKAEAVQRLVRTSSR